MDEVESRLSHYTPLETDAKLDAEMVRIIRSAMTIAQPLPAIPAARQAVAQVDERARRRAERRNRA